MSPHDPIIEAALETLVPRPAEPSALGCKELSWESILEEAGVHQTGPIRQRLLSVLALAAIAAAVIVGVAAAVDGRWFLRPNTPKPTTAVDSVTGGTVSDTQWQLKAFISDSEGLCVVIDTGDNGGESCGLSVKGGPLSKSGGSTNDLVGYAAAGLPGTGSAVIAGPAAANVDHVTVVLNTGRAFDAPTVPAPAAMHSTIRFYAVAVPNDKYATSIRAFDSDGRLLATKPVETPPALRGSS